MRTVKVVVTYDYVLEIDDDNDIVKRYKDENDMLEECAKQDFDGQFILIREGGVKVKKKTFSDIYTWLPISEAPDFHHEINRKNVINSLKLVKEMYAKNRNLKELGIEMEEYMEPLMNVIEERIALSYVHNDRDYEEALKMVHWWLEDEGTKTIVPIDGDRLDVSSAESFVQWLLQNYVPF